ncbi:DUF992 domain-containing protein [Oceaniradius stylonematis]|uniref:DUF992 domain-containing protein n=1 Tax=Oceaniradius stylonematis TaxID=2184161 RepID=A0A3A8AJT1_9HYPH|nr:DUF992 domain-containing protein [Oceaniradius stylonematis]RKF06914.1 DUF992 domain-containing protein [Oceaniradius stylonematis]
MTFKNATLAALVGAAAIAATPAAAQTAGVQLGQLVCQVDDGTGFIFGSSKDLLCTFTPANDSFAEETYTGVINKYGIDVGVTGEAVILWTVVAAEEDVYEPRALTGTYTGATASAAFAAGLGANVLVGGSETSFALQPVSVSVTEGVNVAVGIAEVILN